jgi:hypothetical protein
MIDPDGRMRFACILALVAALTAGAAAQVGGKPATGNPTPGTPQPEPPNLNDRITLTGCVRAVPARAGAEASDPNTPSDARFELVNAERRNIVPAGTGGSALATSTVSRTFWLYAIESQLTAFVGTQVEISGEVRQSPPDSGPTTAPTLLVEFVQKIAASCP